MKRIIYTFLLLVLATLTSQAQSFTIVDPPGLTPPYELTPGTEVTFKWDYFFEIPTAVFTHTEEPDFSGFGPDPLWTEYNNFVDNLDGTYNITLTINEPLWVWGAYYSSFIGWTWSEVIEINIASPVVASGEDLLLCDDGEDAETLSVADTFATYQWFFEGTEIEGANTATYEASEAGSYFVAVTLNSEMVNSNILNISYIELDFTGAFDGGSDLVLTGTSGMDSYQWLSGPDTSSLTSIPGANSASYTAAITGTMTYYAVEATLGSCTIATGARPVVDEYFAAPVIEAIADTNEYDVVCAGVSVSYSVNDGYATYKWLKDGSSAGSSSNTITLSQSWQEGTYSVEVTTAEWPEIIVVSDEVTMDYQDVIQPYISGVINYQKYCPGEMLTVIIGDEGYNYTWYMHENFSYTEEDIIEVAGYSYSFTFESATYITVVAEYQGCTTEKRVFLDSYENANLFLSLQNFDQEYLCTDSSNVLYLPSWAAGDYTNFKWYEKVGESFEVIDGEDTTFLVVDAPGIYQLEASVIACPSAVVTSNEKTIYDYTERSPYVWSTDQSLCVGDTATLNLSGSSNWTNLQWFEESIEFNQEEGGHYKNYVPLTGAGTESTQAVTEFQTYLVKAKHKSCPNGLKTSSNVVGLKPTVNPDLLLDPNYGVHRWLLHPWDSVGNYLYCSGESVLLTVDGEYDSYSWHSAGFTSFGNYQLGDEIAGETTDSLNFTADVDWVTAVVEQDGCIGYSDPVLIDTWVFNSPVVASSNNSELCEEGDSTLLHIAFPGAWGQIEWTLDGVLIPGANSDSIWATEPGQYVVITYPEVCPEFAYTSGVGPEVKYLYSEIAENETQIYALPELGDYEYQWFLNGDSLPQQPLPWIIEKEDMDPGEYTVAVSNPDGCAKLSDPFAWMLTTGINELLSASTKVYPNPVRDELFIDGLEGTRVNRILLIDLLGKQVMDFHPGTERPVLDVSGITPGIYVLDVHLQNGESFSKKIIKK